MRVPEVPALDQFKSKLDHRLRNEVKRQRRITFPFGMRALAHRLHGLVKPLIQSGAMAMTAIVVIIAVSATPAAKTGDLDIPIAAPLSSPDVRAISVSDAEFLDLIPAEDVLAVQKPDNSDIVSAAME